MDFGLKGTGVKCKIPSKVDRKWETQKHYRKICMTYPGLYIIKVDITQLSWSFCFRNKERRIK
jgi:hypothetical protein